MKQRLIFYHPSFLTELLIDLNLCFQEVKTKTVEEVKKAEEESTKTESESKEAATAEASS